MGLTDMPQDVATKEKLQDFTERYDQGQPWEGISDDEAREQYDKVAPQLDDREYEESARELFERLDPEQRKEAARELGVGETDDPDELARETNRPQGEAGHAQGPDEQPRGQGCRRRHRRGRRQEVPLTERRPDMGEVKKSIEVEVPVSTAYNQWTQFEEFPQFMENVESVTQLDDTHLRWVAEIGGRRRSGRRRSRTRSQTVTSRGGRSRARRTRATSGSDSLDDDRTRIQVVMNWEPEGFVEATAEKIGRDDSAVKADLERFKEMVEGRGVESGEWRGQVVEGDRVDN